MAEENERLEQEVVTLESYAAKRAQQQKRVNIPELLPKQTATANQMTTYKLPQSKSICLIPQHRRTVKGQDNMTPPAKEGSKEAGSTWTASAQVASEAEDGALVETQRRRDAASAR